MRDTDGWGYVYALPPGPPWRLYSADRCMHLPVDGGAAPNSEHIDNHSTVHRCYLNGKK